MIGFKTKVGLTALIITLGIILIISGVVLLIFSRKSCKEVECEKIINNTICTLTYNNVTCGCEENSYEKNHFSQSTEKCQISTKEDEPCPSEDFYKCEDNGMSAGYIVCFILGGTIIVASCFFPIMFIP